MFTSYHHCGKIPKKNILQGGKVAFAHCLKVSGHGQWVCCFGVCAEEAHHGARPACHTYRGSVLAPSVFKEAFRSARSQGEKSLHTSPHSQLEPVWR